jgi:hypothetical protein
VSSRTVHGPCRPSPPAFPLPGTPMTRTTNLHQGAHHTRSRPAPVDTHAVVPHDRHCARPDTVDRDVDRPLAGLAS